jgi:hypothetical protein
VRYEYLYMSVRGKMLHTFTGTAVLNQKYRYPLKYVRSFSYISKRRSNSDPHKFYQ